MKSKLLSFLFGYEKSQKDFEESHVGSLERRFAARVTGSGGNSYAKRLFNSPWMRFSSNLSRSLASLPLRSYGVSMLFFGIITMLLNFADFYFGLLPGSPAIDLIVGAAFTLISIPLLCTDTPLIELLQKWTFTDVLLFDILCLRRIRHSEEGDIKFKWHVPVIAGTLLALISFFPPIIAVLISIAAIILVILTFSSPEFAFMVILFFLPLLPVLPMPTLILTVSLGIAVLSFIIKVLLGKRRLHFEQYDTVIILFMLFAIVSGIANGTVRGALSLCAVMLIYFLASNLVVNRRIADNVIRTVIASSIPVAIYAIIQYFAFPDVHPEWIDPAFAGSISARAGATFANPNVYSVFLLAVIIFCALYFFDKSDSKRHLFYGLPLALNLFALVLTWTRGAWLALVLSMLTVAVIKSRRCPKILLIFILLIPIVPMMIPESITQRFLSIFNLSDTSIASRLSIWRSSLRLFTENIFGGVGIGESAFREEFLKYAEDSVTAPHSHNLFLQIGCEMGIFALVLFLQLLLIRLRHRASYARYVRSSSVGNICTMVGVALFALILFGMTDYIFYNSQMTALFFAIFGIGSATLRISKQEYEDARESHFGESSETAAELNLTVRD